MKHPLNIGIIGVGRWGANYLRTFNEIDDSNVTWIFSKRQGTIKEALQKANSDARNIKTTTDYRKILCDENVDAVAIASSGSTHYNITKEALLAGKHVLVEKPLAFSAKDAKELCELSRKRKKILMVGHLHLYNPGIIKLKNDISQGLLGKIRFINCSHFGNGPVRGDMGAIWDFFPHTISILIYLLGSSPFSVSVNGQSYIKRGVEDVITMDMEFPGKVFAASMASWLYPLKKMEICVVGEKLYAAYDDYAPKNKLQYFEPLSKDGKSYSMQIPAEKPLTNQLMHFIDCVQNDKAPLTGCNEALEVTKILEAAQKSLNNSKKFHTRV